MIALSASIETIERNPEYKFQWSIFECTEEYIRRLWDNDIPENVAVIHLPPKSTEAQLERLLAWAALNNDRPVVVHPNHSVLRVLGKYEGQGLTHICLENFPYSNKKPLRTPLNIMDYAISNGFGICYDYAHVDPDDEPAFRSVEFLRSYLPFVTVVHFSGNRHEKLNEDDWRTWESVIYKTPASLATIQWFCLEHQVTSEKAADATKLLKIFSKLAGK